MLAFAMVHVIEIIPCRKTNSSYDNMDGGVLATQGARPPTAMVLS